MFGVLVFSVALVASTAAGIRFADSAAIAVRNELTTHLVSTMNQLLGEKFLLLRPGSALDTFFHADRPIPERDGIEIYRGLRSYLTGNVYLREVMIYNGRTHQAFSSRHAGRLPMRGAFEGSPTTADALGEIWKTVVADDTWFWLSPSEKRVLEFGDTHLVLVHPVPMYRRYGGEPLGLAFISVAPGYIVHESATFADISQNRVFVTTSDATDAIELARFSTSVVSVPRSSATEGVWRSAKTESRDVVTIVRSDRPARRSLATASVVAALGVLVGGYWLFSKGVSSPVVYTVRDLEERPSREVVTNLDAIHAAIRNHNKADFRNHLDLLETQIVPQELELKDGSLIVETIVGWLTEELPRSVLEASITLDLQRDARTISSFSVLKPWLLQRYDELLFPESKAVRREQDFGTSVKKYIDEHVDAALSLGSVAEAFHMSAGYLSRLFKRAAGEKFSEYMVRARFSEACRILVEEPEASVREVSRRVGYFKVGYFIKLFRERTGLTPGLYRKQHIPARGASTPNRESEEASSLPVR